MNMTLPFARRAQSSGAPRTAAPVPAVVLLVCLLQLVAHAARSTVITVAAHSVPGKRKASVIAPDSYFTRKRNRYSVIYLLHGYGSNHTNWPAVAPLKEYADRYQFLCVCPDAGPGSWYIDSPMDSSRAFKTWIAVELVARIDSTWRTHGSRDGRALVGSSMGGHGALTLAASYPRKFSGAGSISGIVDLTEFPDRWEISTVLGELTAHPKAWKAHSFVGMIDTLYDTKLHLVLDCGTDDFALRGNRKAHEMLLRRDIDHQYFERPGNHSWRYVRENAEYHFLYFSRILLPPGR